MTKLIPRDYADIKTVGIPRGLLFYRYGTLWKTFLEDLGRIVIVSDETDKAVEEAGDAASVDECCLASKIYLGHVAGLIGRCDAVFVPCYASGDHRAGFCTKFQSATDLVRNTFRDKKVRVLPLLVENVRDKKKTRLAFMDMAFRMGVAPHDASAAWKHAVQAQADRDARAANTQEETLRLLDEYRRVVARDKTGREERPLAILLAAHPYISHDKFLSGAIVQSIEEMGATVLYADETDHGKAYKAPLAILLAAHPYISHDKFLSGAIVQSIEEMGATVLYADETDHGKAYKASFDFSETLPWAINRELIGSILMLRDKIDGIVLVSAFPCGPDSMTDDAIMRCIEGVPILNLMIDAQSGTAGVQTRIESFVDILRFQQKGGYIHG